MAKRAYVWRQSWSPEAGHAWRFFGEVTPQKDSKGSGFGVSSSEPERKDHRGGVLPSLRPLRLALKNPAPLPLFFNGSFLIHNSTQLHHPTQLNCPARPPDARSPAAPAPAAPTPPRCSPAAPPSPPGLTCSERASGAGPTPPSIAGTAGLRRKSSPSSGGTGSAPATRTQSCSSTSQNACAPLPLPPSLPSTL